MSATSPSSRGLRLLAAVAVVAAVLLPGSTPSGAGLPEGGRYFPYDSPTELVTHVYGDILFRAPTASERTAQATNVVRGRTAATLATKLGETPEFHTLVGPQVRLYQAFFLRAPDRAGLAFWVGRVRAGMSLNKVADLFATSDEFATRYGALDDAGFVALIYTNVLERPGDVEGQAFWVQQLGAGWSRGRVMALFSESAENKARTAVRNRITSSWVQVTAAAPFDDEVVDWTRRLAEGETTQDLMDHLYATPALERRATLISVGGAGNAWSYLDPPAPGRWDPCEPVTWRLNPAGAPSGARVDVREAFRRVAAATGLTFVEGPDTSYTPSFGAPPPGGVIYVAYTTPSVLPQLSGSIGVGGYFSDGVVVGGFARIDSGFIALNRSTVQVQTSGFSNGGHGSTVMHEIAHSVGLGHTSAKGQAMYPYVDGGWQGRRWGNGDLTGLSSVGSRRGCYPLDRSRAATDRAALVPVIADEHEG